MNCPYLVNYNLTKDNTNTTTLKNQGAYIDNNNSHRYMRLGRIYHVKSLGYTVYDLSFEQKSMGTAHYDNQNNNMDFTFYLPDKLGYNTRTEGILSASKLIDWNNNIAVMTAKILGLNGDSLIWTDGMYRTNFDSYIPWTPHSIYRFPNASSVQACHWVLKNGNFFQDLAISMMYAYVNNYTSRGYIPSSPKSQWLHGDYGIGYNYYDTRFNADSAMALICIYADYKDDTVQNAIKNYINFYLNYSESHAFTVNKVTYVPDYMGNTEKNKPTHCSLNHYIAEMRLLYLYYENTNDKAALNRAHNIRDSICASYKNWIKPNGDLKYKVMPSGKFLGADYPLVTYNDLKITSEILLRIDGEIPSQFTALKNSKEKWAKKNGWLD